MHIRKISSNFAKIFIIILNYMTKSAILSFTVENYRSIANRRSINFVPASIKDKPDTNIDVYEGKKYLRTIAIYGANSSGKSNLIRAIAAMGSIVRTSVKINEGEKLPYDPFALIKGSEVKPTLFAIDFIHNDAIYQYGFSYTEDSIVEEWLIQNGDKLFIRTKEGIGVNNHLYIEGENLETKTNSNRLFLSVVGQLGGQISNSIIKFFNDRLNVISGIETDNYRAFTQVVLNKKKTGHEEIIRFFLNMQLGFLGIKTIEHDFDSSDIPQNFPKELKNQIIKKMTGKKSIQVLSSHGLYDENGTRISTMDFDFDEMESEGTKKLFDLAGPIFDTIKCGAILIVDELDAKMHPLISQELVKLFNDPIRNPLGAQLIFTTHDTNLLSSKLLRRDQIWLTEKDIQERTDVYNIMQIILPDGTKPRGDGNMERNYIRGRYGAIPYFQNDLN